jgi:hypothetical protein
MALQAPTRETLSPSKRPLSSVDHSNHACLQPLHPVQPEAHLFFISIILYVFSFSIFYCSQVIVPPSPPKDRPRSALIQALKQQQATLPVDELNALSYTQQLHQQALLYALPSMYLMRQQNETQSAQPNPKSRQTPGALGSGLPAVSPFTTRPLPSPPLSTQHAVYGGGMIVNDKSAEKSDQIKGSVAMSETLSPFGLKSDKDIAQHQVRLFVEQKNHFFFFFFFFMWLYLFVLLFLHLFPYVCILISLIAIVCVISLRS